MQARDYRPDVGRFLQQDTYEAASADLNLVGDPLTQNRYAFAGGNPVNNIEFDGHTCSGDARTDPPLRREWDQGQPGQAGGGTLSPAPQGPQPHLRPVGQPELPHRRSGKARPPGPGRAPAAQGFQDHQHNMASYSARQVVDDEPRRGHETRRSTKVGDWVVYDTMGPRSIWPRRFYRLVRESTRVVPSGFDMLGLRTEYSGVTLVQRRRTPFLEYM